MKLYVALAAIALTTVSAYSEELVGTDTQANVTRTGKELSGDFEFDRAISAEVDRVYTTVEPLTVQVPVPVCQTSPDNGSGDWKNFFNAPKAEKAQDLASAIQGLSVSDAQQMVENGFFTSKPRSWSAFAAEISRFDSTFNRGIAGTVLGTYGQTNMTNLGYYSTTTCTETYEDQTVMQEVQEKQFYQERNRNFHVSIQGGALLKGESEQVTVDFDGLKDQISVSSNYNDYVVESRQMDGGQVNYIVSETRKSIAPDNTLSASASSNGGELMLNVSDNAYDPEMGSREGQTIVVIDVRQAGFLGISHSIGTMEKTVSLTDQNTTIDTGIRPDRNKKVFLNVSLKRVGSIYFNGNASGHIETNKVQF